MSKLANGGSRANGIVSALAAESDQRVDQSCECVLGVDVGGTFTDIVVLNADGRAVARKVLSSPPDFDTAIRKGVSQAIGEKVLAAANVRRFSHGATVATNAIITRNGARTGLITTKGFRDVLEIRRMRVPRLYDMGFEKPEPLIPRRRRLEVNERLDAQGRALVTLELDDIDAAIQQLRDQGVESIAVCYLHSYANAAHEILTKQRIRERARGVHVSISSEVLPESKEYERTSTTAINAYVQPLVTGYLDAMTADLRELGIGAPIMVMQSNGGMMHDRAAREFPVHIVESGPAAGVTGVHRLTEVMAIQDAICLDMGGTTSKAAIIEDGEILRASEYEVGGAFSVGHRLMRGSGYLLRVPSIDIAEVGAGGGSIAWIDAGGALRVGPQSAGARPGPACYSLGGERPAVTDANLILGLTNPDALAGGALRLHPDMAERAIRQHIAGPLGFSTTEAAWGIRTVANSSLIRALRAVSSERGRDPGLFTLVAFGGMGPVHALALATELNIRHVIIPPLPGVFSALGLLLAEVEYHLVRAYRAELGEDAVDGLESARSDLLREGLAILAQDGSEGEDASVLTSVDLRYVGQDHALEIPMRGSRGSPHAIVSELSEDFTAQHKALYGYASEEEAIEILAVRGVAKNVRGMRDQLDRLSVGAEDGGSPSGVRSCYFGPELGWITTDVISRRRLSGEPVQGPLLIEEESSLTLVPPNWSAHIDEWSNIRVEVSER